MNIKEYLDILKDLWTPTNASKIRMAINNALEMMGNNLKENIDRQDNVESQFQDVIENTTDKDVISAPEIIAARNGESNLKARLDKENQEVTAQLAQKVSSVNDVFPNESGNVEFVKIFNTIPTLNQLSEGQIGLILGDPIEVPIFNSYRSASTPETESNLGGVTRSVDSVRKSYIKWSPTNDIILTKLVTRMKTATKHYAGGNIQVTLYRDDGLGEPNENTIIESILTSEHPTDENVEFDLVAEFNSQSLSANQIYYFVYEVPDTEGYGNEYRIFGSTENKDTNLSSGLKNSPNGDWLTYNYNPYIQVYAEEG